jgi:DNA polymerase III delta subunit
MLYLLYGEDTYRSKKNLREIIAKFLLSGSGNNLFRVTAENFNVSEFVEAARAASLLGGKYLYVGEGLLADDESRTAIIKELPALHNSENVIVFWESAIEGEMLAKIKEAANKVTEFAPLSGARLKNFIKEEAAERGVKLSEEQILNIIESHGGDLWGVVGDLEKLVLGAEIVAVAHTPQEGEAMFDLLDAVALREGKRAILLYEKYKHQGMPAEEIYWRIIWQAKTLGIIKALQDRSPSEIKKETGLHEFVIKKNLQAAAKWHDGEIEKFGERLIKAMQDYRLGSADLDNELMLALMIK